MSTYPSKVDDNTTIINISDNLSELGTTAINQLRSAVFAIEKTVGLNPQGAKTSLSDRVNISINPDGTIKAAALSAVGLVTLPITNNQVGNSAGIKEFKLALDYPTATLATQILALSTQVTHNSSVLNQNTNDIRIHIAGGTTLSDGSTLARHVASQIDLNAVPSDTRDPLYTWVGLRDKNGNLRSGIKVADGLLQINNDLVAHENSVSGAHPATAITVDSSQFTQIPVDVQTVQQALNAIDTAQTTLLGIDRAILNSNGIPRAARAQAINAPDGYNINIVPETLAFTFLGETNKLAPNDSPINGDDVIKFNPTNTSFSFDLAFANVKVGDIIRVNYGNGIEGQFDITSIRFTPGSDWTVRINGSNLYYRDGADGYSYARIDRPRYDISTQGVYAVAAAISDITITGCGASCPDSVIVGSPRGAIAVGIGFDPNQIDNAHSFLYLRLYPSGDPSVYYDLPGIDVSGNLGATPGQYSIDSIVNNTNRHFRAAGYNYRFIAFNHKGEFGLMLADSINKVSFSIINGVVSGTSIVPGTYTNNIIADASDGYDALGLGFKHAALASPTGTFTSSAQAAGFSTIILQPAKERNALVNGVKRDLLLSTGQTQGDGYWSATITAITPIFGGTSTVEYTINKNLISQKLAAKKTIIVQPISTPTADVVNYGRFFITDVAYIGSTTHITVLNGVHGTGSSFSSTLSVGAQVLLYFSNDSVSFDQDNLAGPGVFHRYHEVFADSFANTFAVERARMPKLNSISYLNTSLDGWRIRKVSEKMKGFGTAKTVRFNLSGWNIVPGQYNAYLSDPNNSLNSGPITTATKNYPARFYDVSGINYIEIEFEELNISPGTSVPDGYIDIQIFDGLTRDGEVFPLAGISHNEKEIVAVTDLREFGTLSEKNFTDSAINFIQAGERYLHANGVVRGFEAFFTNSPTSLSSVQKFTGGLALVNGKFVGIDTQAVKLPDIYSSGGGTTVEFFVCATETGQLKTVVKSVPGIQFFTNSGYWVESLSFKNIIDNRKDLTILYRIKAVMSPTFNILEVSDCRRFVTNESINEFTFGFNGISTQIDYINRATFTNVQQIQNWNNEYGLDHVKIKQLDIVGPYLLGTFTNKITFEGGVINIVDTGLSCLMLTSNVTLKNSVINYTGAIFYNSDPDIMNIASFYQRVFNAYNFAAIVVADPWRILPNGIGTKTLTSISDVKIEGCTFNGLDSRRRPPFIAFYGTNETFENIKVIDNTFIDMVIDNQIAIGLINTDTTYIFVPTYTDVIISGNICKNNQTLMLSGVATPTYPSDGTFSLNIPVAVSNCIINKNIFGGIGYNLNPFSTIIIDGNIVGVIASDVTVNKTPLGNYGLALPVGLTDGSTIRSFGNPYTAIISNNQCNYIKAADCYSSVINNNIINDDESNRNSLLPLFVHQPVSEPWYRGICIRQAQTMGVLYADNICCANMIGALKNGLTVYNIGIDFLSKGVVNGNNIESLISVTSVPTYGIRMFDSGTITGNNIKRGSSNTINGYIYTDDTKQITIVGNKFDSLFIDSSNLYYNILSNTYSSNNVNQVVSSTHMYIGNAIPFIKLDTTVSSFATYNFMSSLDTYQPQYIYHDSYNDAWTISFANASAGSSYPEHRAAGISIPLSDMLPINASILKVTIHWSFGAGDSTTTFIEGTINAYVSQNTSGLYASPIPVFIDSACTIPGPQNLHTPGTGILTIANLPRNSTAKTNKILHVYLDNVRCNNDSTHKRSGMESNLRMVIDPSAIAQ